MLNKINEYLKEHLITGTITSDNYIDFKWYNDRFCNLKITRYDLIIEAPDFDREVKSILGPDSYLNYITFEEIIEIKQILETNHITFGVYKDKNGGHRLIIKFLKIEECND